MWVDYKSLPLMYQDDDLDIKAEKPHYNVSPDMFMPVIYEKGKPKIELMQWGYVPFWEKSIHGHKLINARAETLAEKPAFKKAFQFQRCLIPANGFFEWHSEDKEKTPYFIHLKDRDLFTFAGLYESTEDENGKEVKTYTIITTEPNRLMAKIHHRMPVIMHKDEERMWLDHSITEPEKLERFLKPYPAEEMEAWVVSSLVNNPRNDIPNIIEKVKD